MNRLLEPHNSQESFEYIFLDKLEKIYSSYLHVNIVGGALDTPPIPTN